MSRRAALLFTSISLSLAACSHVPAATIYELWNFDMATADPAVLRAAVRIPLTLHPQPGGVVLTVTKNGSGASSKHDFILEEVSEPSELAPLSTRMRHGFTVHAYRLSKADIERVRALQKKPGGGGSIGIGAKACRTANLPKGAILSSTFLKVDAKRGYLTVLDDIDLRKELGEVNLDKEIPPCAAA